MAHGRPNCFMARGSGGNKNNDVCIMQIQAVPINAHKSKVTTRRNIYYFKTPRAAAHGAPSKQLQNVAPPRPTPQNSWISPKVENLEILEIRGSA